MPFVAGFCLVGAEGLEPSKPKRLIYSQVELPLSDTPMEPSLRLVNVGILSRIQGPHIVPLWCERPDSNRQQLVWKTSTLPVELLSHFWYPHSIPLSACRSSEEILLSGQGSNLQSSESKSDVLPSYTTRQNKF